MKLRLFILIIFVATFDLLSQGVFLDDKTRQKLLTAFPKENYEPTRSFLPDSFSLEEYIPQVYNQTSTNMCAAYAMTTCATILIAKQKGYIDSEKIQQIAFSPHDFYYQAALQTWYLDSVRAKKEYGVFFDSDSIYPNCKAGLNPIACFNVLDSLGFKKIEDVECPSFYPCSNNIESRICESDVLTHNYRLYDSINRTKGKNIKRCSNINQIKSNILDGQPGIFTFNMNENFPIYSFANHLSNSSEELWNPRRCTGVTKNEKRCKKTLKVDLDSISLSKKALTTSEKRDLMDFTCNKHRKKRVHQDYAKHMMLIVGYDNNKYGGSFRILNSWGAEWGDNGMIWIKYEDFFYYVDKLNPLLDYFASNERNKTNLKSHEDVYSIYSDPFLFFFSLDVE